MRRFGLFVLIALCAPLFAHAHASPLSSEPASSASLSEAPKEIRITFSERPEDGASNIKVEGPKGIVSVGTARVDPADARVLSIPLQSVDKGTYKVQWSVVSEDDGHFTRGSYFFALGESVASSSAAQEFEFITRTTETEALAMTVELMGNGLLWAGLLLWAFALRRLLPGFPHERVFVERTLTKVFLVGSASIVLGGALGLLVKSADLASLNGSPYFDGVFAYGATAAGEATLARIAAGALFAALFLFGRKAIFASSRFTWQEGTLMLALGLFAYFRAIISHATANPFMTELSIAVNFLHVIEKDFWAGVAGVLLIFTLVPRARGLLKALLPRAYVLMAFSAAAVAASATYIVWLHLKSFENLFSTTWGGVFIPLGLCAILLVAMRTFQVLARLRAPVFFARALPGLLAAEFVLGVCVVYFSSVVILTSPPLLQPHTERFSATNEGLTIGLQRSVSDDASLLITAGPTEPRVMLGGAAVELEERFSGGYAFPLAIVGEKPQELVIEAPQEGAYDARASFSISSSDFAPAAGWESTRSLDAFTIACMLAGLAAVMYALGLAWLSRREMPLDLSGRNGTWRAWVGAAAALVVCVLLARALPLVLVNPFKATCESDGNMWHLMLPSRAGVPTSQTPHEGCMWGMGAKLYHFADAREYARYRSLGDAEVRLDTPEVLRAGVPADLRVSIKDAEGNPATLFVDMERLVHMVIISADQSVFAHIHANESQDERASSSFGFRYAFPKAGEYLVSIDYAHGVSLQSKRFKVSVEGASGQGDAIEYPSEGGFQGYSVSLKYPLLLAGEPQLLRYSFSKDGAPVDYLEPYLSAAMHIAVVKNDLSSFVHTHGEVHASGTPPLPVRVVNGKIAHDMKAMLAIPPRFGPNVEAHVIFPEPGLYTVWGEFKAEGKVIPTAFTVRVEE